jgi:hypothetical protein
VDFTDIPQINEHLADIFGDASVTLPRGLGPDSDDWPPHWPKVKLDDDYFLSKWRAWQATLPAQPEN